MKRMLLTLLLCLLMLPVAVGDSAYQTWDDSFWNTAPDFLWWTSEKVFTRYPTEIGWYPLEQWEIDECTIRPFNEEVQDETDPNKLSVNSRGITNDYTATVSAERWYFPQENEYLYEVAWYILPSQSIGAVTYTVVLKGEGVEPKTFGPATSSYTMSASPADYQAFIDTKKYTEVVMYRDNTVLIKASIPGNDEDE